MKNVMLITGWILCLSVGCGSDLVKKSGDTPSQNNTTDSTNGSTNTNNQNGETNNIVVIPEPVEGEVTLQVQRAQEIDGASYALEIAISNGLDESISIAPSNFRLGVGPLELTSVDEERSTCSSEALLSSQGSVVCNLVFDEVEAEPDRLIYAGVAEPVVASFVAEPCERCGGNSCVDLQTSWQHCGECNRYLVEAETCVNGEIACAENYRLEEGFCVLDDPGYTLRPLPIPGNQSCLDVCGSGYCEGILGDLSCEDSSAFGGTEREFPGLDFCQSTGNEANELIQTFGSCTAEAAFCVCYE